MEAIQYFPLFGHIALIRPYLGTDVPLCPLLTRPRALGHGGSKADPPFVSIPVSRRLGRLGGAASRWRWVNRIYLCLLAPRTTFAMHRVADRLKQCPPVRLADSVKGTSLDPGMPRQPSKLRGRASEKVGPGQRNRSRTRSRSAGRTATATPSKRLGRARSKSPGGDRIRESKSPSRTARRGTPGR